MKLLPWLPGGVLSLCLLSAQTVPPVGSAPLPSPPPGLAGWWTFDEFQTTRHFNHAGDLAADLVWEGMRSSTALRPLGGGRQTAMAHTGDVDADGLPDFLQMSPAVWEAVTRADKGATLLKWMSPESLRERAATASIFDARRMRINLPVGTPAVADGFAERLNGTVLELVFAGGPLGAETRVVRPLVGLQEGVPFHLAVVLPPPSGGDGQVFLNGKTAGGPFSVSSWTAPQLDQILIGLNQPGLDGGRYDGGLDDLMIFSRRMGADEVAAVAAAGPGGMGAGNGHFDTDTLRVGLEDGFAGDVEPTQPGPRLRSRFPATQWRACDEFPGDFVPDTFGHSFRVGGSAPASQGDHLQGATLELRWRPRCPECDHLILSQLRLDCVAPGEKVGPQSPWDLEIPLTALGGKALPDGSYHVTLDLGKLPDGKSVLDALRAANFLDVVVEGELVDFMRLHLRRQSRHPRAFGLQQQVIGNAEILSSPQGLTVVSRDHGSGAPTGKRVIRPMSDEHYLDCLFDASALAGSGSLRFITRLDDHLVDELRPMAESLVEVIGEKSVMNVLPTLRADLDLDGRLEVVTRRFLQVWNHGALMWAGPANEKTTISCRAAGDTCILGGKDVFLTIESSDITLNDLPNASSPVTVFGNEVRLYSAAEFQALRTFEDRAKQAQDCLFTQEILLGPGVDELLISSEHSGLRVARQAEDSDPDARPGRRRMHQPLWVRRRLDKATPLLRQGGGLIHEDSWGPAIARRPVRALATHSSAGRELPTPPVDLPLQFGLKAKSFDVQYEVPSVRSRGQQDVYVWKVRTVGLLNGVETVVDSSRMIAINEPGASLPVRLEEVDFSALEADGYRVIVRGWDPEKARPTVLHDQGYSRLPEVRLEDFPTVCGKLGGRTPCRRWSWPDLRRVDVDGKPFEGALDLLVLATGVEKSIDGLLATESEFSGMPSLAVAGVSLLPVLMPEPSSLEIRRGAQGELTIRFDPGEGRLQGAPALWGPWRELPAAGGTLSRPRAADGQEFYRLVDPSVPLPPR